MDPFLLFVSHVCVFFMGFMLGRRAREFSLVQDSQRYSDEEGTEMLSTGV